jgi:hypothetical protein
MYKIIFGITCRQLIEAQLSEAKKMLDFRKLGEMKLVN